MVFVKKTQAQPFFFSEGFFSGRKPSLFDRKYPSDYC